jgi:hypothetical protein
LAATLSAPAQTRSTSAGPHDLSSLVTSAIGPATKVDEADLYEEALLLPELHAPQK